MVRAWKNALRRCVVQTIELGHLSPATDPDQLVFEMYGLILALHHDARFLKLPGSVNRAEVGFERLIASYQHPSATAANKPTSKKTA